MNNKEKLFRTFSEFTAEQDRGSYLIGWVKRFVNWDDILARSGFLAILLPIPKIWIFLIVIGVGFLSVVIKSLLAKKDKRLGLWEAQNRYNATEEHLSPFNVELKSTIKEICKKIDVQDHFKDY